MDEVMDEVMDNVADKGEDEEEAWEKCENAKRGYAPSLRGEA